MKMNSALTAERLREILAYDPLLGTFTRRVTLGIRAQKGWRAGSLNPHGYRRITIGGVKYYEERLAFLYMNGEYPKDIVDHKDLVRDNNSWENLRESTHSQNHANEKKRSNNTSGHKGVYFRKDTNKWFAAITHQYKFISLGNFSTPEEAHSAYVVAAEKLFGEFARAA